MATGETCVGWSYRGRVLNVSIGAEMVRLQVVALTLASSVSDTTVAVEAVARREYPARWCACG
ncbi:MAG: hypothetical protein MOB07_16345 [Acidobacteria bacterium]|nr:hypothetical protein [Acidobacteriota bacterium]